MNGLVTAFIVGMSAGAIFAGGFGLRTAIAAAILVRLLNAFCAHRDTAREALRAKLAARKEPA